MQTLKGKPRLSLISIFFTFFVDNLSWSIVFPIFAPFFLDKQNHFFSIETSVATRTTILGIFLGIFPLAQFFGAPIIGEYADRRGRKKALVYTIFFAFLGFALTAYSMQEKILSMLFMSRLLTGFFSGNLSVCLAAVADLSKSAKMKIRYFGYLAVFAGFAFIIGAYIGGKLSDSEVSEVFNPSFPLWIATGITFLNFIFVLFGFEETQHPDDHSEFDFFQGFHNIQEALRTEKLKLIYIIYFLFLFAWNILLQFTPVLVIEGFQFTNSQIGDVAAFMGICWAIGSGLVSKFLLKKFSSLRVMEVSLLCFTIFCGLVVLPDSIGWLLFILGACVLLAGLAWPICTNVISNTASSKIQGKVLGMSQSMQSLAMAISPLVAIFTHIYQGFPFIIAALFSLGASLLYFKLKL